MDGDSISNELHSNYRSLFNRPFKRYVHIHCCNCNACSRLTSRRDTSTAGWCNRRIVCLFLARLNRMTSPGGCLIFIARRQKKGDHRYACGLSSVTSMIRLDGQSLTVTDANSIPVPRHAVAHTMDHSLTLDINNFFILFASHWSFIVRQQQVSINDQ